MARIFVQQPGNITKCLSYYVTYIKGYPAYKEVARFFTFTTVLDQTDLLIDRCYTVKRIELSRDNARSSK